MKGGIGWDEWYSLFFRKVKVFSIQSEDWIIKSKILHNIWTLLTIWHILVECTCMFYECFIFWFVYFDDFDQLSAPVINFVQLSATFANALHNVLCQIVLKTSKCSNVHIFKCSNVQTFRCSNVPIFQCSNVPMFQFSNAAMFQC